VVRDYTSISFFNYLTFTECLKLTKALQKTADTLQTVANLYEGHVRQASFSFVFYRSIRLNFATKARRTQLATHESLKLLAHPAAVYEASLLPPLCNSRLTGGFFG
jgi:hypothetical protein